MSFDRLQERIDQLRNPTVVGLDPALEHIPPQILEKHIRDHGETLWAAAISIFEFNAVLINALCDIVPAVKPQMAFYEALGPEGMVAFEKTCRYARTKGMYVICDGKRNDIGSTAEAYSAAYLGTVKVGETEYHPFEADALTVNAYLGSDGIKPFIEAAVKHDKAIFALVKTSNPSAGELQDRVISDSAAPENQSAAPECHSAAPESRNTAQECQNTAPESRSAVPECQSVAPENKYTAQSGATTLYAAVGDLIEDISRETIGRYGYTRAGAVVGATYPEEIEYLRERLRNTFFLIPGYGAQGGSASDVARAFDENGHGAIINSSRAIIAAWKKTGGDYADAARAEALRMRDELSRFVCSGRR